MLETIARCLYGSLLGIALTMDTHLLGRVVLIVGALAGILLFSINEKNLFQSKNKEQ